MWASRSTFKLTFKEGSIVLSRLEPGPMWGVLVACQLAFVAGHVAIRVLSLLFVNDGGSMVAPIISIHICGEIITAMLGSTRTN